MSPRAARALAVVRAPAFAAPLGLRAGRPTARAAALAAGLLALVALGYLAARETTLFSLRAIEVEGATPEVRTDMQAVLEDVQGTSLAALDAAALERRLEAVPSVGAATVDRAFPHTLEVRVVPERPLAVVRDGARAWLIAESGRVVRSVSPTTRPRLPRIRVEAARAPRVGATLVDAPMRAALAALREVPPAFPASVLYATAAEGEVELVLREGPSIRLGLPLDITRKLAAARAVLATLTDAELAEIGYLDASVPERVVTASNSQP